MANSIQQVSAVKTKPNRQAVAAYVLTAIFSAGASGAGFQGHDHRAAFAFGFCALAAGAIAVFVAGPRP